jgi:formyltetrahydrofolate-dependent phosphoribosylglycinamide formyltransferase
MNLPSDISNPVSRAPLGVVVLVSRGGTTMRNLISKIAAGQLNIRILRVLANTARAGGLAVAAAAGIPTEVIASKAFASQEEFSGAIFDRCRDVGAELVVMGGFLKQITIPADFCNRVTNMHPALIPSFCGKGFYGHHVHEAVLAYGVKLSGCTVHFADDQYDHGPIILQKAVPVLDDDTPQSLATRVFEVESEIYPAALQLIAEDRVRVVGRRVKIAPARDDRS